MKCLNEKCKSNNIEEDDNFCHECGHWTSKGYIFLKNPENISMIKNGAAAKTDSNISILFSLSFFVSSF